MTAQNRVTNKGRFENGDKPQGSDYVDLIDSMVAVADTTAQQISSDLIAPKFIGSTEVSSPQVNAVEVSASVGSFTRVQTGNLGVTGTVSASAMHVTNLTINGSANIPVLDGPVQVGPLGKRGRLVLAQSKVVSAAATTKSTAANVPEGSDILQITYFQQTPLAASAAATINLLVGTSAHDSRFGRFNNVSAQGFYSIIASTQTSVWNNVSGADSIIYVHATAASGAIASGARGMLTVQYVQKQ